VTIIEEYWRGVLQRLEAEVAVFAKLVTHQGERGRENEAALARVLEAFVPRRYGIGSGLLIDTEGRYSRQTDLVVFEQSDEPAILAQTTQLLFPVENALAAIEVKTTLRNDDIEDCHTKQLSVRQLVPRREHSDGTSHPLFVVLAYTAAASPQTVATTFAEGSADGLPDLVCVLSQGLLIGRAGVLAGADEALNAGLALLRDGSDNYVTGTPTGPDMLQMYEGKMFPIVPYERGSLLADPGRALLLFAEALVRLMAKQQGREPPAVTYYLPDETRALAPLNVTS